MEDLKEWHISRMWEIDAKSQFGQEITEDEKKFYIKMKSLVIEHFKNAYDHWQYHSSSFKIEE